MFQNVPFAPSRGNDWKKRKSTINALLNNFFFNHSIFNEALASGIEEYREMKRGIKIITIIITIKI